jgi:hypothetical protein
MVYRSREEEAQYLEIFKALSEVYGSFYANAREAIIAVGRAAAGLPPEETVQKEEIVQEKGEGESILDRENEWFETIWADLRFPPLSHREDKLEKLRELKWAGKYKELLKELEIADLRILGLDEKEVYRLLLSTALNAVDICSGKEDVAGLREIVEDECFPPGARDMASTLVDFSKEENPLQGDGLAVPVPSKLKKSPKAKDKKGRKLRR